MWSAAAAAARRRRRKALLQGGPKSKPLPNGQKIVLNRIKTCERDNIYCQLKV